MRISMRNHATLALLLLGVVFLSGCVGQPPSHEGGKGLAISSFAPDFAEIRSGERVTISAMIDNVGEYDATDVSAQLFGINIGGTEWAISGQTKQVQTASKIRRSDATLELPGESHQFDWSVTAPKDLRVDNTYTANLRVYYKYGTVSNTLMRLMTYDYLRSLPSEQFEEAKASTGVSQSTSSAGPLSVSFNVGNRPLVVYDNGDTFSVQMEIKNVDVGNAFDIGATYPGYPGTSTLSSDDLHAVHVDITTSLDINCANTLGAAKSGKVKLTKGETKTLFCTVTIPSKADLGNTRDYTVTVTLTYGYYIDSSTAIKVLKSEAPSTGTTPTTPSGETNTVLTMQVSDTTPDINDVITISGYLVDGSGKALGSKSIRILRNGASLKSVSTNSDGYYETTYTVSSDSSFTLEAEFAGDSTYAGYTSGEKTVTPTSSVSYTPTCTITETSDSTYKSGTAVFYQPSSISNFKVTVDPDAATSKVTKVSFPATTSASEDVSEPSGTTYSHTYDIRPTETFSGASTVTVYYTDGATATCSFNAYLDNAKPVTAFSKQEISTNNYRIALDCSDGSGSGCGKIYYCTASGCTPSTAHTGSSVSFDKQCTGTCYVRFQSLDNVGNKEDVREEVYGPTSAPLEVP